MKALKKKIFVFFVLAIKSYRFGSRFYNLLMCLACCQAERTLRSVCVCVSEEEIMLWWRHGAVCAEDRVERPFFFRLKAGRWKVKGISAPVRAFHHRWALSWRPDVVSDAKCSAALNRAGKKNPALDTAVLFFLPLPPSFHASVASLKPANCMICLSRICTASLQLGAVGGEREERKRRKPRGKIRLNAWWSTLTAASSHPRGRSSLQLTQLITVQRRHQDPDLQNLVHWCRVWDALSVWSLTCSHVLPVSVWVSSYLDGLAPLNMVHPIRALPTHSKCSWDLPRQHEATC